ncbi:MAG TPA: DJ-1/PfpI family protein [Solirubrobacteraceae bacterium]|jgi:putative intracellular protease/amidase|nr:DJ-1/PfpI family protein [Solirubrobacteraceae bacterium]
MDIAIPIYPGFTALDAVGPYEVLSNLPGATVRFIAAEPGPVTADTGMLTLVAEASLDEVPAPEIVCVPGGRGTEAAIADRRIVDWVRAAHDGSEWTTSVCTGAQVLGAAGILDGLEATTYWMALDSLRDYGARPCVQRVVRQGKVVTAAGVSSGIDMALTLASLIAGDDVAQAIQLGIEYDPQPPFDAGSEAKAPDHVREIVRAAAAQRSPA